MKNKNKNKNVRYSNEDMLSGSPRLYPKWYSNGTLYSDLKFESTDCDITIADDGYVVVRGWQVRSRQPNDTTTNMLLLLLDVGSHNRKIVWKLTPKEFMEKIATFQIGCVPLDLMEKIERRAQ